MKRILILNVWETFGLLLLGTAWQFFNSKIFLWWVYPIQFIIIFIGLVLLKIGFEKWVK